MIKLLISSLLMAMLTGCVSPYYYPTPQTSYRAYEAVPGAPYQDAYAQDDYEDGYYGDYDPDYPSYVPYTAYSDTAYYPWWSIDYFYLGSHYYRPAYRTSFSIGLASGYPYGPYYYPAYYPGWYGPWYYNTPWLGFYYSWGGYGRHDHNWRRQHYRFADRSPRLDRHRSHERYSSHERHGSRDRYGNRDRHGNRDRYGNQDRGHRGSRGDAHIGRNGYRGGGGSAVGRREPTITDRSGYRRAEPPAAGRDTGVTPSRERTDRGMVIVNRGDGKRRPSRTGPVYSSGHAYRVIPRASETRPVVRGTVPGTSRRVAPNEHAGVRSRRVVPDRSRTASRAVRVDPDQAVAQYRYEAPRAAPSRHSNSGTDAGSSRRESYSSHRSARGPRRSSRGGGHHDSGAGVDRSDRKRHR